LLNISKSATSTALNMLMMTQKVTYTTRPGDRKRYFASNIVNWEENASAGFKKMLEVNQLLKEILDQRTPETPVFNEALRNFIEFMEYMKSELPQLYERWRNRKTQPNEL
jgi:DNA-binding transcriptional regulator GbsR (MarR family)